MNLTRPQYEVLAYVERFIASNGYAPSLREIAHETNRSHPTVHSILKRLEKAGAVKVTANKSRAIEVLKSAAEAVGKVGPGLPWGGVLELRLPELKRALGIPTGASIVRVAAGDDPDSVSIVLRSKEPAGGLKFLEVGQEYPSVEASEVLAL